MFGLRYAAEMKAAFLRRPCGKFVFHLPTSTQPNILERYADVYRAECLRCQGILHDRLRGLMMQGGMQDCLTPVTETSWWRALNYSPEDTIRLGTLLHQEKTKREALQEKLASLRPERDAWKERAKAAESALARCRKLIPSFLRRLLKVDTQS